MSRGKEVTSYVPRGTCTHVVYERNWNKNDKNGRKKNREEVKISYDKITVVQMRLVHWKPDPKNEKS